MRERGFSVILILLAGAVFAQNPQELRTGSFINGNLNSGQEIWYSVRASDAGVLIVETTGDTDTYLEAYDAQRNLITENDDGPSGLNARVEIMAARGASYLFKLRGYGGHSSGPFRILASMQPVTELRIGSAGSGNLVSGEKQWFIVRTAQNGIIRVETSGNTDTVLEAYSENMEYIISDDDSGDGVNARIDIVAGAGRTYYFVLAASYDSSGGPFRITADSRSLPSPAQLNPGSFINGNIVSGQDYWYSSRVSSRVFLIVETAGSTDTMLQVFNESLELLSSDDDGGEGTNARVEIIAEPNRTYLFRLRGFSDSSGPYRITASSRNLPAPVQLNPGSFTSGNIASGQDYWYSVRVSGRGLLVVETTGNIDTMLEAYSESFDRLAADDDGGDGNNARIEIMAEPNRTYLFRLKGYSDASGPYRIFASMN